jgi:hypothetical protein
MNTLTRALVVRVSTKERQLITEFARTNKISVSEAVRSLLKEAFQYMKQGQFGGGVDESPLKESPQGIK